jgi:Protein of unknown function, DUF481
MNSKQIFITVLLLWVLQGISFHASSQQVWDTLYLKNGQVVFGTLKKIYLGLIQFKVEDISQVDLKMSKVKTLKATSKLYRIETINKKVFYSTLEPANREGYVRVGDSTGGGGEIPLEYIGLLSYYAEHRTLFEGNVSAGYNYTKSSNIGRINLDATLRYIMKKFVIKNVVSAIVTSENNDWYRDRESFQISGTYLMNTKWKSMVLGNYQLNRELGLESRFQEGIGIGYNILSQSKTRLAAVTGFVVNQEKSFSDEKSSFTAEVPLSLDFEFFKFTKPEISISNYHNLYFSLSEKGRTRYDGELRIDWKVISDFFVDLKFYFNYDTKPLSGTGASSDYGSVIGITYKWD